MESQEFSQGTGKRKWKTGIVKTWMGTDPSKSAPQVDYGNEQAAIRAQKKKKRKLEAKRRKEAASHAGESTAGASHVVSNPWALPPAKKYTDGGPMEVLLNFDDKDQAVDGEGAPGADGLQHAAGWAPDSDQPLSANVSQACGRLQSGDTLDSAHSALPSNTSIAMDCEPALCVNTEGFNAGWKRFGPQGRDITGYVQQPDDAPTVVWPTDVKTILPFVPDESSIEHGKNIIAWDERMVQKIASTYRSSRDRPDLCMHVGYTNQREALRLIKDCMSRGMPLVFDDYPTSLESAAATHSVADDPMMDPITWSLDPIAGVVGADLTTPRDFQDAAKRELDSQDPYVTASLEEFATWLNTPDKVRCILDLVHLWP